MSFLCAHDDFQINYFEFRGEVSNNPSCLARSWFAVSAFEDTTFIELAVYHSRVYHLATHLSNSCKTSTRVQGGLMLTISSLGKMIQSLE